MYGIISLIYFSPIKSLSFTNIESCEIKKDLGILNDRKFAFSRIINKNKAFLIEKNPNKRKLDNFLLWFYKKKRPIIKNEKKKLYREFNFSSFC